MPGLPHAGFSAERRDAIEQGLARLDVGDDRRPGLGRQHRFCEDGEQLIAPDDAALAVHRPDPVAVAVEGDAEIEALVAHQRLEIREIGLVGRVRVMVGEAAVDLGVEQVVLAGQQGGQPLGRGPGRAVAGIPADPVGGAVEPLEQAIDIAVENALLGNGAFALLPVAGGGHRAHLLDVGAEKGVAAERHLEAVIVGRIVAAGDHDAAGDVELGGGEIEHRRRPEADLHHIHAAFGEAADQRGLHERRAFAAVAADRDARAAGAARERAEAAPERMGVVRPERFPDDPANVIFAKRGRVELVRHQCLRLSSASSRSRAAFTLVASSDEPPVSG